MTDIQLTEYVIKRDPRLNGWIAQRIVKTAGRDSKILDRQTLTSAKQKPHLAARALARSLSLEGTNATK